MQDGAERDLVQNQNDSASGGSEALQQSLSFDSNQDWKAAANARLSQAPEAGLSQFSISGSSRDFALPGQPERPANGATGPENAKKAPRDPEPQAKPGTTDNTYIGDNSASKAASDGSSPLGPYQNQGFESSRPGQPSNLARGPENAKAPPKEAPDSPKPKAVPAEIGDNIYGPGSADDGSGLGPGQNEFSQKAGSAKPESKDPEAEKDGQKQGQKDGKKEKSPDNPGEKKPEASKKKQEQSDSIKAKEPQKRSIEKEPRYLVMDSPFPGAARA